MLNEPKAKLGYFILLFKTEGSHLSGTQLLIILTELQAKPDVATGLNSVFQHSAECIGDSNWVYPITDTYKALRIRVLRA